MTDSTAMDHWLSENQLTESQWRTAVTDLFPGANPASVRQYFLYCKSRRLDPMKKPAHIVPMRVKDSRTGNYEWRDVIMPGIYEYRTTAQKTGSYAGQSDVEFGPDVDYQPDPKSPVYRVPEYAKITVKRIVQGIVCEWTGTAYFSETCATTKAKNTGILDLNAMWKKRPRGQLAKCSEADALRKAFPDELGGEMTIEEMEGKEIESSTIVSVPKYSDEQWEQFHELITGTDPVGYFLFMAGLDEQTTDAILRAYKDTIQRGKGKEMDRVGKLMMDGKRLMFAIVDEFDTADDDTDTDELMERFNELSEDAQDFVVENVNPFGANLLSGLRS